MPIRTPGTTTDLCHHVLTGRSHGVLTELLAMLTEMPWSRRSLEPMAKVIRTAYSILITLPGSRPGYLLYPVPERLSIDKIMIRSYHK